MRVGKREILLGVLGLFVVPGIAHAALSVQSMNGGYLVLCEAASSVNEAVVSSSSLGGGMHDIVSSLNPNDEDIEWSLVGNGGEHPDGSAHITVVDGGTVLFNAFSDSDGNVIVFFEDEAVLNMGYNPHLAVSIAYELAQLLNGSAAGNALRDELIGRINC